MKKMQIIINDMSLQDLELISDTLISDFDDFWNVNTLKLELENPNSKYYVAKIDNTIVGFAGIWKSVDDIHITNIVTRKDLRHNGIASKLLEHLIEISRLSGLSSLTLEVNEKNINAIKLYEKYNFQKIGLRRNYYSGNENAIIMTLYF